MDQLVYTPPGAPISESSILLQSCAHSFHQGSVEESLKQKTVCYACNPRGKVVAGALAEISGPQLLIEELWVEPALRGQGVGRELLRLLENHARQLQLARILANPMNQELRQFYGCQGYHAEPDEVGDQAARMEKKLATGLPD